MCLAECVQLFRKKECILSRDGELFSEEYPMSRNSMDVITSYSAEEIRTYCQDLAQELEITLVDACWEYTFAPAHTHAPYHLVLTLTQPWKTTLEFWFTRAQVLGYVSSTTKTAIRIQIRNDLETRLRDGL